MESVRRHPLKWGPLPPNDIGRIAYHVSEEGRQEGKDGDPVNDLSSNTFSSVEDYCLRYAMYTIDRKRRIKTNRCVIQLEVILFIKEHVCTQYKIEEGSKLFCIF
jgi:hypothetical protein